jgi:hypothetical protein
LFDDDDFYNQTRTRTLASNPTFMFTNLANLGGLNAGLNGLGGTEWFPSAVYMYQGAMAVCGNDWCGPYVRPQ